MSTLITTTHIHSHSLDSPSPNPIGLEPKKEKRKKKEREREGERLLFDGAYKKQKIKTEILLKMGEPNWHLLCIYPLV